MLRTQDIPLFANQGILRDGTCSLTIAKIESAGTLEEAWKILPDEGTGVVVLSDRIVRYDPKKRNGLLVDAEVVKDNVTTILRSRGLQWQAWTWEEDAGDSHRYVEFRFLSSEPGKKPPDQLYRQYWTKTPSDDGVEVWQPIGSRFCGFQEG